MKTFEKFLLARKHKRYTILFYIPQKGAPDKKRFFLKHFYLHVYICIIKYISSIYVSIGHISVLKLSENVGSQGWGTGKTITQIENYFTIFFI